MGNSPDALQIWVEERANIIKTTVKIVRLPWSGKIGRINNMNETEKKITEIRKHYYGRWDTLDNFQTDLFDYIRNFERSGLPERNPERYKGMIDIRDFLSNYIAQLLELRDKEIDNLMESKNDRNTI